MRLGLGSQPGISLVVSHTFSDDLEDTDQPVILSGALSGVGPESASADRTLGPTPSESLSKGNEGEVWFDKLTTNGRLAS